MKAHILFSVHDLWGDIPKQKMYGSFIKVPRRSSKTYLITAIKCLFILNVAAYYNIYLGTL